jgi:CheY-like chemotaxis protein
VIKTDTQLRFDKSKKFLMYVFYSNAESCGTFQSALQFSAEPADNNSPRPGMLIARVLVVDDFKPFRRYLRSMLDKEPELRVVDEASDGLEALEKIKELQPDLILLDIGLPLLNGIEVGRRVRELAPRAKILFVSQEFSFDVVQEAFRLGALGYVHKQRSADDLMPAIKAVLSDTLFVSRTLSDYPHSAVSDALRHEVVYCSSPTVLINSFCNFIATTQSAGVKAIVLATKTHLEDIDRRLKTQGLSVDGAIERGSLLPLDVAEVLPQFMVNDMPDPVRFLKAVCALADSMANKTTDSQPRIAACGECAPFLMSQGNVDGAIRLEQLWDQFARAFKLDTLCIYASESFDRAHDDRALHAISAEHSATCSQ